MHEQVRKFVITTLTESMNLELNFEPEATTRLRSEGLGLESIFLLELANQIEQEYRIQISEEEIDGVDTLQELESLVIAKVTDDLDPV